MANTMDDRNRVAMNDLAEAVSTDVFPTIAAAGRSLGHDQPRTDLLWQWIRKNLGGQAR